MRRKTTEEFKQEVFNVTNWEYEVVGDYINNRTNIDIKHTVCNRIFSTIPTNFMQRLNCKLCTAEKPPANIKTHEKFIEEVHNLYGDEYIVIDDYIGAKTPIRILHNTNKCGMIFKIEPTRILLGHGCPTCSIKKSHIPFTKSQDVFVDQVKSLYGDEYSVIGEYISANTNIMMQHNVCGFKWDVRPSNFIYGLTRCPNCKYISKGEELIKSILNEHNILYTPQKTFNDLIGLGDGLLSYDFYLFEYNLLIEFQGIQHEKPIEYFGGEESFKMQQEHDKRKREYAKSHGIDLLEIWYWDFDNIEEILNNKLCFNNSPMKIKSKYRIA